MPRKTLPTEKRRKIQIKINATREEREMVNQAADALGKETTEWGLELLLPRARRILAAQASGVDVRAAGVFALYPAMAKPGTVTPTDAIRELALAVFGEEAADVLLDLGRDLLRNRPR